MARTKDFDSSAVLDSIKAYITEHGIPPTIVEIKGAVGMGSKRTVLRYLRQLESDGLIRRWHGSRGIEVIGWNPMVGEDAAQLRIKMKIGGKEVWVPCYLDGGSAIIFDRLQFERETKPVAEVAKEGK